MVVSRWAITKAVRPADDGRDGAWIAFSVHGVDGARRLVEDEDAGVGQQGAREGEQLLFPDGEQPAALADLAVEPAQLAQRPPLPRRGAGLPDLASVASGLP